ncbi:MAG: DNA-3-methyladenine glycosylase 2 family protein [Acidobacteria bacterium]|nr:DNA-3-methyladenine glycosylase 2 family protein [Acidobacteriota bacterium]
MARRKTSASRRERSGRADATSAQAAPAGPSTNTPDRGPSSSAPNRPPGYARSDRTNGSETQGRERGSLRPLSNDDLESACAHLIRRDPRLGALIRRVGPCRLGEGRSRAPFAALVRAILWQQLSGKAAETIHGRVLALLGGHERLTPPALLAVDPEHLRAAGVSRPKIAYLRDLAERVHDGRLDLDALEHAPDEDVVAAITAVKGLGRWSAEMFLMFRLNRPDVFPVTDLGIVKGVQALLGMKQRPKPVTMVRAAEAWRPYRSVAAWYLWRINE